MTPDAMDASSRSDEADGDSRQDGNGLRGDDVDIDALAADGQAETSATDAGAEGDAACPSGQTPPPIVASVGTISFVVTNDDAADRYVVTQGQACDPFAIRGEQLSLPFRCTCECAVPRAFFTLTTLASGQSLTIPWDGRRVVPYTTYFDCRTYGSSQGCESVANGSLQPVSPGTLTVSIGYTTEVPIGGPPPGCTAATGGFQCTIMSAAGLNAQCGSGGGANPPMQLATQDFVLPASGNATVPVSIP